ncbi:MULTISPECIES: hypothetical protein [Streptomyces]|uniref:hypothetical protein n=1 Tax=Streptomyces dengpaensis TaxID=2049881 RepID=UPI00142D3AA6|nr:MULTISPECIES: hypothetical protein [Streptomyces]
MAKSRIPLGALRTITADTGLRSARSCRTVPSTARAATTPAAAPPTTAVAQVARTIDASTTSLCRRSGFRRHRHPRIFVRLAFRIDHAPSSAQPA